MTDASRPTDKAGSSSDRQTAGRSADARGETGTDADFLAPKAGSASGDTRMGGIPSTADSTLSPSMSGSAGMSSEGPMDRERPSASDAPSRLGATTPAAAGSKPQQRADMSDSAQGSHPPKHIEGPLESLGKAVSAPVFGAADDDGDERHG